MCEQAMYQLDMQTTKLCLKYFYIAQVIFVSMAGPAFLEHRIACVKLNLEERNSHYVIATYP